MSENIRAISLDRPARYGAWLILNETAAIAFVPLPNRSSDALASRVCWAANVLPSGEKVSVYVPIESHAAGATFGGANRDGTAHPSAAAVMQAVRKSHTP